MKTIILPPYVLLVLPIAMDALYVDYFSANFYIIVNKILDYLNHLPRVTRENEETIYSMLLYSIKHTSSAIMGCANSDDQLEVEDTSHGVRLNTFFR